MNQTYSEENIYAVNVWVEFHVLFLDSLISFSMSSTWLLICNQMYSRSIVDRDYSSTMFNE